MLVNQIRNIMTTMELNLRKQCFTEFILSMSEEEFTELENYAKTLQQRKVASKSKPYPWAPTLDEMRSIVAESEENYRHGKFIEEEDMDNYLDSLK